MYYPPFYFENSLIDYFDAKVLGGSVREEMMAGYEEYKDYIPAWSLHRLVSALTNNNIIITFIDNIVIVEKHQVFQKSYEFWDDVYDNICDAYEWLIKEGYFNKEYLV